MAVDFKEGNFVKAKRSGWNEQLTVEQTYDLIPLGEDDESTSPVEIEGELEIVTVDTPQTGEITVYLVGGQEADPETIEVTEA